MNSTTKIGYRVEGGKIQKVSVTYDAKGRSTVTPLEDWRQILRTDFDRFGVNFQGALRSFNEVSK